MLPLLLMLLSDPSASPAPPARPEPEIRLRVFDGLTLQTCSNPGFQRIERPTGEVDLLRNDLTYTPNNEVRHYLLLDRSIRGCPAPISYPLPDRQGGFVRDFGAPSVRPPIRRPSDVQPPRSSE